MSNNTYISDESAGLITMRDPCVLPDNGTYYLAHFTVNGTAITKETVPGSITVGKELGKAFSNSTTACRTSPRAHLPT